ncbi:3-hydroxyisobutyrate dehydrogenase [Gammaproteobacteria bacterium]|nr:3-hydroxyisobutyrate dehydrogenase [Gammaproteobacteria bacterium]
MRVAFIGLGTMGYPMAGHLVRAGHDTMVYNRTPAKAQRWAGEFAGTVATTPQAAAGGAEIVFACVGADADLREVVLGASGAFAGMDAGAIFFDCTTTSAVLARELAAEAARRGLHFIDGPVSGGEAGALRGQLTVMCGGEEAAFERARPVALAFARAVTRLGPPGSGQLAKMVNQICIAGLVQGLAEGIAFGQAAGLDMHRVLEAIGQGAAQSWQMDNRGATMIGDRFDFGFAVDWMRKDLGLCLAEAGRNGAQLPVAALVDRFYAEVQAMGGGRWDTSSLLRRLRRPG